MSAAAPVGLPAVHCQRGRGRGGPIVAGEPLTVRQEAYVREHEAFEASGVLPAWEQQ